MGLKHLTVDDSGWTVYQDSNYTTGSPFSLTTAAGNISLPNFANANNESQMPSDIPFMFYAEKVLFTGLSGTFVVGEEVTGGTSAFTGDIVEVGVDYLCLNNITGYFTDTETLTGGTSGATATASGNGTQGGITGRNGDAVMITLEFKVRPTSVASDVRIKAAIDIGGAVGEIYPRDFSITKGNGVEHYYLSSFLAYTLDTWEANSGIIKVQASNSNLEIYDIRIVLSVSHRANA